MCFMMFNVFVNNCWTNEILLQELDLIYEFTFVANIDQNEETIALQTFDEAIRCLLRNNSIIQQHQDIDSLSGMATFTIGSHWYCKVIHDKDIDGSCQPINRENIINMELIPQAGNSLLHLYFSSKLPFKFKAVLSQKHDQDHYGCYPEIPASDSIEWNDLDAAFFQYSTFITSYLDNNHDHEQKIGWSQMFGHALKQWMIKVNHHNQTVDNLLCLIVRLAVLKWIVHVTSTMGSIDSSKGSLPKATQAVANHLLQFTSNFCCLTKRKNKDSHNYICGFANPSLELNAVAMCEFELKNMQSAGKLLYMIDNIYHENQTNLKVFQKKVNVICNSDAIANILRTLRIRAGGKGFKSITNYDGFESNVSMKMMYVLSHILTLFAM